jgi:hypothetical protein
VVADEHGEHEHYEVDYGGINGTGHFLAFKCVNRDL